MDWLVVKGIPESIIKIRLEAINRQMKRETRTIAVLQELLNECSSKENSQEFLDEIEGEK